MIKNFEEITEELNNDEFQLMDHLIRGFKNRTKDNPIKATEIIEIMNGNYRVKNNINCKLTGARLRKICNYIRTNGLLPLIATSNGYYISNDRDEIKNQIISLEQRAKAIINAAAGLKKLLT